MAAASIAARMRAAADGRGQLPGRPPDYQAAAPRPAIPGNGVNLWPLITPTRTPAGVRIPPIRIFPVELTQYKEISPDACPWNLCTPRTAVGCPVAVEYRMNPVVGSRPPMFVV